MKTDLLSEVKIDEIFTRFKSHTDDPVTELDYVNNYTLLVAVVLSAQATDVSVNKATKALFAVIDTPEKMLKLGEEGLKQYVKTIGLYNSKAKNIIKLSEVLIEKHNSEVPEDFDKLVALPGVGEKTANVVLNCAFGHSVIAVDTHVFRVSNRIGMVSTKTPEATAKELMKVIKEPWLKNAHHWLILHGRYICKARKPECSKCFITDLCLFKEKNL